MAYKCPELIVSPPSPRYSELGKSFHPQFSDEPVFYKPESSDMKNSVNKSLLYAQDYPASTYFASPQASTQNSISLNKWFLLASPKRSSSSLTSVLKVLQTEDQGAKLHETLQEKLKRFEKTSEYKRSATIDSESLIDIKKDKFSSVHDPALEKTITFEGFNDIEIPQLRWCAYCKAEVMTKVLFVNNSKTFWSAVGIFLSGGVFGCFMLPYMTNACKGTRLICHKCERMLL